MFKEYDKVRFKPTGEVCFVIVVDEEADDVIYGLESEDQEKEDWFRWCKEDDLELVG